MTWTEAQYRGSARPVLCLQVRRSRETARAGNVVSSDAGGCCEQLRRLHMLAWLCERWSQVNLRRSVLHEAGSGSRCFACLVADARAYSRRPGPAEPEPLNQAVPIAAAVVR